MNECDCITCQLQRLVDRLIAKLHRKQRRIDRLESIVRRRKK